MLKKKTNLVDGSMYNEKYNLHNISLYIYNIKFNCNHVRLLTCMEYIMRTNWNKKTLNEVREIAKKTSTNVKNFSDDDLKQFLNIFSIKIYYLLN